MLAYKISSKNVINIWLVTEIKYFLLSARILLVVLLFDQMQLKSILEVLCNFHHHRKAKSTKGDITPFYKRNLIKISNLVTKASLLPQQATLVNANTVLLFLLNKKQKKRWHNGMFHCRLKPSSSAMKAGKVFKCS